MRRFFWYYAPLLFFAAIFAFLVALKGLPTALRHPLGVMTALGFFVSLFQGAWGWKRIEELRKAHPTEYDDWKVYKTLGWFAVYRPKLEYTAFERDLFRFALSNFYRNAVIGLSLVALMIVLLFSGYFKAS